jgi:hypothetical protein
MLKLPPMSDTTLLAPTSQILTAYWARTLRTFVAQHVHITLTDGRTRTGTLTPALALTDEAGLHIQVPFGLIAQVEHV